MDTWLWKRFFFHRKESWATQCLQGSWEAAPRRPRPVQGHQSWQLPSRRNPLVFTVLEGINLISAMGSWWKRRTIFPRKESLTNQCLMGNWKAARSPELSFLAAFIWEQSKNVHNFRSQNPTFSPGCLGRNDGSFPQEGKPRTTVSHRQVRSAPQETKANPSHWYRQLSSGRNPQRFPILGGRIPLVATGTWLGMISWFSTGRKVQEQCLMGSWEVDPWSPRPQSYQSIAQMAGINKISPPMCSTQSSGWMRNTSFLSVLDLFGIFPLGFLCVLDFVTM